MFRAHVLPLTAFLLYSALKLTWRIRIHEPESLKKDLKENKPIVIAHWHGHELGIVFLFRRYRACTMTSTSKDGQIMDKVVRLFGGATSRGSSTRGAVSALKGIIRLSREGWRPSVAVDGPKGPIYKAKPGVFEISKLTGGKIYPLTVACDRKFTFEKSWNKAFLPKPFARVEVVWGEGLGPVPKDLDSRDPKLASDLETALTNAGQQAANIIAVP